MAKSLAARAQFKCSDWFGGVDGCFDLIVSNPPYISLDAYAGLMVGVRDFEPRIALTDEGDGLSAYRLICEAAGDHLTANGRLMVEIGFDQGAAVQDIFAGAGFTEIQCLPDIEGRNRVVCGVLTGRSAAV